MLGLTLESFLLLMLLAFLSGAAGCVCTLLIYRKVRKSREKQQKMQHLSCENTRMGWQRQTRDEQMYNGR